jgi:hypothetical protein
MHPTKREPELYILLKSICDLHTDNFFQSNLYTMKCNTL